MWAPLRTVLTEPRLEFSSCPPLTDVTGDAPLLSAQYCWSSVLHGFYFFTKMKMKIKLMQVRASMKTDSFWNV